MRSSLAQIPPKSRPCAGRSTKETQSYKRRAGRRSRLLLLVLLAALAAAALLQGLVSVGASVPTVPTQDVGVRGAIEPTAPAVDEDVAISFSAPTNSVTEGAGDLSVTLKRTGGSTNEVVAKIALINDTTSPTDQAFAPGTLDPSFVYDRGGVRFVREIALQPDGKVITDFYSDALYTGFERFNEDGSRDWSFNAALDEDDLASEIMVQPDGKIVVAGNFSFCSGVCRSHIARLNEDGSLDTSFNPGAGPNKSVEGAALQPDGKVIIVGEFTGYNGTTRNYIVRLNADGSLDNTFNTGAGPNNRLTAMLLQPDGKIIIGGYFDNFDGTTRHQLARLNADGSLDATFDPGAGTNTQTMAIAVQPDGKILIGGFFTTYNGTQRRYLARLNTNGSLDTTFNQGTGPAAAVWEIAVQPDGKIIIVGGFENFGGVPRKRVARLNPTGSLDATFNSSVGADNSLYAVALRPNGKILIGGNLNNYNGAPADGLAQLNGDLLVRWPAGDTSDKTILLPIVDDYLQESDETFTLRLSNLTGGAKVGEFPTQTVTILDNNDLPAPVADAQSVTVNEDTRKEILLTGSSAGGGSLIYSIVTWPVHGTLSNVGSQTVFYTPGTNYSGTDRFMFKVNDGRLDSEVATVSITVAEGGVIKFAMSGYAVNETSATATIAVSRTGVGATAVSYNTSGGTATGGATCGSAGADYVKTMGVLSWADGETGSKTFNVPICNDAVFEGVESLNLTLSYATGSANLGSPSTAVLKIADNETVPALSVNDITITEGSSGTTNANFTAKLSGASAKPVSVNYATLNGTAVAPADYNAVPLTKLTFAPGETSKTVAVLVRADALDEINETFQLKLTSPIGAAVADNQGTCTIKDDDAKPSLRINNVAVTEGNAGAVAATFTVALSAPSGQTVTVNYATADGTAAAPSDYTALASATLTFLPGQTTKSVTVQVKGDTLKEANQTFFVNLSGAVNALVADTQGLGTITNDD